MRPKLAAITVSGRHLNLVICPASAVPTAPTPSLSGGESQRLRIASRLRSSQHGTLYVLDEPSTGLHPLDVATLAGVLDRLLDGRGRRRTSRVPGSVTGPWLAEHLGLPDARRPRVPASATGESP